MSDRIPALHEIDTSGALQEAAHRVAQNGALEDAAERGDTRAALLRKAALGGGALMGGGLLLGLPTLAGAADTRSAKQDVDILNYALTLEYLEAEFYTQAEPVQTGIAKRVATVIGAHERAHVEFLQQGLGNAAVAKPTFDFKGTNTGSAGTFLSTAVVLEDTGVAAYIGQSFRLKSTAFILAAASVLAVEARHSAWVRGLVPSREPSEEAFAPKATMKQVLDAVGATGFIKA
jgi:hypothetical protein